jgi:hypothetical protein
VSSVVFSADAVLIFIATKFYPSKTNGELRSLHKAIIDSTGEEHHKISVMYYILLDFDAPTGRRNYSTAFERFSFLPPKYSIYMKGLWHLDRLEFEVSHLLPLADMSSDSS